MSLSRRLSCMALPLVIVMLHLCDATSDSSTITPPSQPANPIIAHVTMPMSDCTSYATPPAGVDHSGGCVNHLYVKWLDAVGVRTVPLPWNADWESMRQILDSVNGVLLPGGDLVGTGWSLYHIT
ncbi:peptidase, putative [Bodo saltans]|uniref:folate gamma-glutamyl hydrolase n=1 Tax=Bodo saltans TaxID=75058 RepID=A0A0S4JPC6_BODSA|nr:peptidase, putative [Bodo saltans]|eukprot:CUG91781.1 peptidase, putative [Bodo saltans]